MYAVDTVFKHTICDPLRQNPTLLGKSHCAVRAPSHEISTSGINIRFLHGPIVILFQIDLQKKLTQKMISKYFKLIFVSKDVPPCPGKLVETMRSKEGKVLDLSLVVFPFNLPRMSRSLTYLVPKQRERNVYSKYG